ncbi:hypothetical protein llap_4041 [Limosa lapponica baueri]|uniref:Uncharacterized protein n=1 Tax=Limosa lapponica baueri TaxID=1758121 RepID=A0A2I0UI12_LIMLA|nr:hypothetical protein llap_4041 [Limosa lapponica baueri]
MIDFLGCKHPFLVHVQFFIYQCFQVLCKAALNPFMPQPVLILVIDSIHMQNLALGLDELHEIHIGPLLKPFQVLPDGISSL